MDDEKNFEQIRNKAESRSEGRELTPEAAEAIENAEITPEEVSQIVEEAVVEVGALKNAGQELQNKIDDPETAASLAVISEKADEALGELTVELPLGGESGDVSSGNSKESVDYGENKTKLAQAISELSPFVNKLIGPDGKLPEGAFEAAPPEEQQKILAAYKEIEGLAEADPAFILASTEILAGLHEEPREEIINIATDRLALQDPEAAFSAYLKAVEAGIAGDDAKNEMALINVRDSCEKKYISAQVESIKNEMNADPIKAANDFLALETRRGVDKVDSAYESRSVKEKVRENVIEAFKKEVENGGDGADIYRSLSDTAPGTMEIALDIARNTLQKKSTGNWDETKRQAIAELGDRAPEALLIYSTGYYQRDWTPEDRLALVQKVINVPEAKKSALAEVSIRDIPGDVSVDVRNELFQACLSNKPEKIIENSKFFVKEIASLSEQDQVKMIDAVIKKEPDIIVGNADAWRNILSDQQIEELVISLVKKKGLFEDKSGTLFKNMPEIAKAFTPAVIDKIIAIHPGAALDFAVEHGVTLTIEQRNNLIVSLEKGGDLKKYYVDQLMKINALSSDVIDLLIARRPDLVSNIIIISGEIEISDEQKSELFKKLVSNGDIGMLNNRSIFDENIFPRVVEEMRSTNNNRFAVQLTKNYNFDDYQKILSPEAFSALQKSTARFVEPLSGSDKDRVRPLLSTIAEKNDDFYATDADMEIFSSYLNTFGVQPTPKLYEYFSNIQKMQRGEINSLPDEQAKAGMDTVERIKDRLNAMRDKIINGDIPPSSEMTGFDYDILAVETAFHTGHFARAGKNIQEMHRKFEQGVESGKVKPLPQEYGPVTLKVERVKVNEANLESCQEEYGRYRSDIMEAEKLLKPEGLENMKKQILDAINAEINTLNISAGPDIRPERLAAQNKRRDTFTGGLADITRAGSIEEFTKTVLKLENNLGIKKETSYTTPYLRRALFAKTMADFSGFEQVNLSLSENEAPALEGLHYIRDIISNALKEHVLNEQEAEKYFSPDFVLTSKEISKLRKIFPTEKIQQALDSVEGDLEGKKDTVDMVPDRGFAGELAGYYSDACYTRLDNMLENWPNVIPCKFIRSREDDGAKELIGAVILIESISADDQPVLIIRANNPRDKYLDNMQAESFCSEVERAATEYAKKRGIGEVLAASKEGTASNRGKIKNYVGDRVKAGANIVNLKEPLAFNGVNYDIQNDCISVTEVT